MKKAIYLVIAVLALTTRGVAQISFTGGHVQTLTVCGSVDSLNVQLAVRDTTLGRRIIFSLLDAPTHGSAVVVDTFRGMSITTLPTGLYYTADSGYAGQDTLMVVASDSVSTDTTTLIITVHRFPYAGTIRIHRIDSNVFCFNLPQRDTATLSEAVSGGVWSVTNTAIASITAGGFFTQNMFATGLDTILYTVTDSGCVSIARLTAILTICESVPDFSGSESGVLITPNPSDGSISLIINAPDAGQAQIQITDVLGRQVYEGRTVTNKTTGIRLQAAAGVYMLTARTAHDTFTKRLLLQ